MTSIELQTPLLDSGIRSVNFFNGRVLSGEDLSNEQSSNREEHRRLGLALGEGIVSGLEVTRSPADKQSAAPTVTINAGAAINRLGQTLVLSAKTDLLLDDLPASGTLIGFNAARLFPPGSPPPVDGGAYLLLLSPVREREGFALGSDVRGSSRAYNASYYVDTVEFRLLPLGLDIDLLNDPDHLRNTIAYQCFGFAEGSTQPFQINPFGSLIRSYGLLDAYRPKKLTDGDVPLAVVYLTAQGGLQFIDQWTVRRRVARAPASPFADPWEALLSDRRQGEAMFLQFQHQLMDVYYAASSSPTSGQNAPSALQKMTAAQFLRYLPPAGYLPVGANGFDLSTFLGPLAPPSITSVDIGLLRSILQASLFREPIKVVAAGSNEALAPMDVYQDPSQPNWVLFARTSSDRLNVTVAATGFEPAQIAVKLGPQTQLTIPLTPKQPGQSTQSAGTTPAVAQGSGQPALFIDVMDIKEPALYQARFTLLLRGQEIAPERQKSMVQVELTTDDTKLVAWLNSWRDWLNDRYPAQNVMIVPPAIFMHPYYSAQDIPDEPQAYAVFNTIAIPLLVNLPSRTLPLPVSLMRAGIPGLADDIVGQLNDFGFSSVDQLAGAWAQSIADATGHSIEYGRYLIQDAIASVEEIREKRRYYSGMNAKTEQILLEMAIADDVALANAEPVALGSQLKSRSFAASLIEQARKIVPASSWSLDPLGLKPDQISTLAAEGIHSKGEFVLSVDANGGRDRMAALLKMTAQQIDDLHMTAIRQITADSIKQAPTGDLTLLPKVDAVIASKLADSDIMTVDELAKVNPEELAQATGLPEDTLEALKSSATEVSRESMDVLKLASITREVASELDKLGINTVANLSEQSEEGVAGAFRGLTRVTRAVLDGVRSAFGGRPRPLE